MLFYASLFLFCIAVSAIALWIYRSVYETGKAAYRAIFPSHRKQYKEAKPADMHATVNDTPTPWGWSSDRGPRRAIPAAPAARSQAAPAPWGWKGNSRNTEKSGHSLRSDVGEVASSFKKMVGGDGNKGDKHIGWPYREEKFDFAGREYKVTRKRKVRKSNVDKVSKPWGW